MPYAGVIHFPNNVTENNWQQIVDEFSLESTREAEMLATVIGELVVVKDPPNLLAFVPGTDGRRSGVIRCSRLFFGGGVADTAEISFQGDGEDFESTIRGICRHVSGELTLDED